MDFDFQRYVRERKQSGGATSGGGTGTDYGFSRDKLVLKTLDATRVVRLALKATTALETRFMNEVIDAATPVTSAKAPGAYEALVMARETGRFGEIPVLVTDKVHVRPAVALEIDGTAFILLSQKAVNTYDTDALRFLIGQQVGHIQNGHLPYTATLFALDHMSETFGRWLVGPARIAIETWLKLGIISADRAGLMASANLERAAQAILDLGKFGQEETQAWPDASDYLDAGTARDADFVDFHRSAPHLATRLQAIEAFCASDYVRRARGLDGGEALADVDKRVERIVKLL